MENLFFELIQVTLGTRSTLSMVPSAREWELLFKTARKQSLLGVCFCGVNGLDENGQLVYLSEELKMQWIGLALQIKRRNEFIDVRCLELTKMLNRDGYKCCLLKGQAFAYLYPAPLNQYRQPGDIDVWLLSDSDVAIAWARKTGKLHYYDYHHADISIFPETEVELHYRPSISRNLIRNARLQKWFKGEGKGHVVFNETLGCNVPDDVFSVILALNHNYWHLLYEGVGLRQMMDLYFILKHVKEEERKTIGELIYYFSLDRFAAASAWVLWHLFDNENEDSIFISEHSPMPRPNERSGRFLLEEIMNAGNFGHHDTRLKDVNKGNKIRLMFQWMKHNFRLFRYYPADVLWTPIGTLRISLWRRFRYFKEKDLAK